MTYYYKCTYVCTYSNHYSCQILIKLEFSRHILENIYILNFMKIPPLEMSCSMRADRHDEAISHL